MAYDPYEQRRLDNINDQIRQDTLFRGRIDDERRQDALFRARIDDERRHERNRQDRADDDHARAQREEAARQAAILSPTPWPIPPSAPSTASRVAGSQPVSSGFNTAATIGKFVLGAAAVALAPAVFRWLGTKLEEQTEPKEADQPKQ
jgi:hypothetical protein